MHVCGEYSDCHGNGGCDGFTPYFPLIRTKRNRIHIVAKEKGDVKHCEDYYRVRIKLILKAGLICMSF